MAIPLFHTTSSITGNPSINGVEIKQWNIYNDGQCGVENLFDPGHQTILYDGEVSDDSNNNSNMITIKALGQIFLCWFLWWCLLCLRNKVL
ncbi:hypothetical protein FRX31_005614 [Thalictrum thalictroides]|uniref:Uncharacterized protein n=1 Tax=Thalictrum thalictroides TaxID=46969 RepID=A0A7J6X4Z4_THATH|nr:hypothetical protein FRX31_005614 [Thalictrum thalictroides]